MPQGNHILGEFTSSHAPYMIVRRMILDFGTKGGIVFSLRPYIVIGKKILDFGFIHSSQ